MRLVDADLMLKRNEHSIYDTTDLKEMLNYEPTAYDVDEVVCQLNEAINNVINHERDFISEEEVYNLLLYFVEIIKRGGVDE